MKNYTTLLVDLDGTLLDIEVSFFLGPMVQAMHSCFSDVLDVDLFREGLFGGTKAIMVETRSDGETNLDGFNRTFSAVTGMGVSDIERRFTLFYTDVFPTLSRYGRPLDGACAFIEKASARGYTLCLATNPIFPKSAVLERLRWSGVDPGAFSFIPGLENMRTCKPNPEFYLDLAKSLDVEPFQCLMVGNDIQQDLPASQTGMGTFIVEGKVIDRGTSSLEPDGRGSLEDLGRMQRWEND
ncbi:MAG: HAD family hydrolase [bacterium]|nr:MAG: HAD family hydrolase [bacterium]